MIQTVHPEHESEDITRGVDCLRHDSAEMPMARCGGFGSLR